MFQFARFYSDLIFAPREACCVPAAHSHAKVEVRHDRRGGAQMGPTTLAKVRQSGSTQAAIQLTIRPSPAFSRLTSAAERPG